MKKIILILVILLLTGCSDYTELENLGIVSSLYITYDTEYKITAEIYDDDIMDYRNSKGSTISEAIHNFDFNSKNKIYLNHLNSIIIDENVLLEDLIYYFLRNPNANNNFYLIITNEEDFYQEEENVGLQIKNIAERLDYDDFFTFTKYYLNKNRDIVIPYMSDDINITNLYTYKKDKVINNLDNHNTFIYSILTKKKSNETLKINYKDSDIVLSINSISKKVIVDKNIMIKLNIQSTILEKDESVDTSNAKTITEIEKITNEYLEENINKFINILKKDKTDILGLNILINNKNKNLNKRFDDYNYDIKVKVNINKKGQLLK